MKKAVACLLPYFEEEEARAKVDGQKAKAKPKIVLATVKGDVHDIGKNIVGVVLGCNNYEVVDLGVMVPADRILQAAVDEQRRYGRPERPDHAVARRDGLRRARDGAARHEPAAAHRRRHDQPPAHGREDRSRVRTAASRARGRRVEGRGRRLAPARARATRRRSIASNRADQDRASRAARRAEAAAAACRGQRRRESGSSSTGPRRRLPCPSFTGAKTARRRPRRDSFPYIDWTFFFAAWELKGRFPAILEHPQYGRAARELYDNARTLLDRIVAERSIQARGVYGFWPANADGDDIVISGPGPRTRDRVENSLAFHAATAGADGRWHAASVARRLHRADRIGIHRLPRRVRCHGRPRRRRPGSQPSSSEHDDYHAIMVKALADRLAEACAEWLHARARRDWGYGADEQLTQADLHDGALSRHPSGVWLSRLPRSQREAASLRSARRRARRNRPDRELRDDARGLGERAVLRHTRHHGISPSDGSAGIRSRITQDEKAPASPKPNAGFCPTWDMNHN